MLNLMSRASLRSEDGALGVSAISRCKEYNAPLDTGFPSLSRRSSSSSDLNDDPREPRVMSGRVLPMTVSFEVDPEGEASRAVSDEAGIVCFGYERLNAQ